MRFTANEPVLDGDRRYVPEHGEYDDVPDEAARRMVSHGWGTSPDITPEPGAWSEPAVVTTPAYDNGGLMPPGMTTARNDSGQPERVVLRPDDASSATDSEAR